MLVAQTTGQAEKLMEAARHKEVMDGDLKAAIEQYRKIVAQFAKQPEIAARALFQLGQCQETLGQAEASKSYERIVREYAGAQQYAAAARARLAALGGDGSAGQQTTRAVWTGPNADGNESSVSRDGRFITFPDWDTGNLGLHDVVTGADRLLTNTAIWKRGESAFAEVSAISRDGKQVAYAWYDDKLDGRYELRVLRLNGDSRPRRMFENSNVGYLEPRDWSPDGKWIATTLWEGTTIWNRKIQQIGLISVQDGSLRVLKCGTDNLFIGGFSSDGRYVVYTRGKQSYIISADAKSEVPLLSGTSSAENPVWTPDGSRIVFVSDRSGSAGLWSVRVADGKPLGEPELLKADFSHTWAMGFARDGSLFYEARLNLTDIYVAGLDPATGKLTSEPKRINQLATNSFGRVAWLPDGNSLSFWNKDSVGALVEHNLATGEEREIWGGKSGRRGTGYTGWFPDRTIMRWDRSQSKGKAWIFRREDSTTGEAQGTWTIPVPDVGGNPVFSPDLMTMYFWQQDSKVPCQEANARTSCSRIISKQAGIAKSSESRQGGSGTHQFLTMADTWPSSQGTGMSAS